MSMRVRLDTKCLKLLKTVKKVKAVYRPIALHVKPILELRSSHATWEHTVLPATRHK